MKRILIIALCFSLLYAGAVWAFAGCDSLTSVAAGHDHGGKTADHHHSDAAAPQHRDSGEIHCPSLFGAFLIGTRISVETERRLAALVDLPNFDLVSALPRLTATRFDLGPPGPIKSPSRPLHLLLSVIRI